MAHALEDLHMPGLVRLRPSEMSFEPSPRRVRALLNGVAVADSTEVKLLLEDGHLPVYYFPVKDVRMDLMEQTDKHTHCPRKGAASYWSVTVGDKTAEAAAWGYKDPIPDAKEIKDHIAFYWNKMDAWFEEDDEVYVHPRDPYKRVDVLNSSRHIRVVVDGETVAETNRARLLFETGLPTRYYIPKSDARLELLEPTDTSSRCPYKGEASYWNVRIGESVHEDIVWAYREPIPENPRIENLLCFFNEKVEIYVDGVKEETPSTAWS